MTQRLPNVILVVMDAARASNFSCYGHGRETTPHIDRLAAEGVLYEQAISSGVWTVPSHASLFTGAYSSSHAIIERGLQLDPSLHTLATILKALGYRTLGVSCNMLVGAVTGLDRGFDEFEGVDSGEGHSPGEAALEWARASSAGRDQDKGGQRATRTVERWCSKLAHEGRPFFIFVNYMEAHLPHVAPPRFRFMRLDRSVSPDEANRVNQNAFGYMSGQVPMSERDFEILRAIYDGSLSYMDQLIGELAEHLRAERLLDQTLLILTADHGENLGEHGMMDHQYCLYDTLLRVPLVIRYPTVFPAGARISEQVQPLDLLPTLLELLEAEQPEIHGQLEGQNLLPRALERTARAFTVAEYLAPQLDCFRRRGLEVSRPEFCRKLRAIREGRLKFIHASDGQHELYDLASDPDEGRNLITLRPDDASQLEAKLNRWLATVRTHSTPETICEVDPEVVARLKGLGYIDG